MSEINLTAAVRQNLLSLQGTAKMMSATQNKLSTGNKVNTALDNPTNYFTAASLNSRAGDLSNLMDSMANGIKTIEAADNGLTSITKTLESMQSTLRQARQDKSFETASYTLGDITDKTSTIDFSGGAFGTSGKSSVKLMTDSALSAESSDTMDNLKAALTKTNSSVTGAVDLSAADQTGLNTKTFSIGYGGSSLDVTFSGLTASSGIDGVVDQINTAITADTSLSGKLTASKSADGKNVILTAAKAEDSTITVGGTDVASVFGSATTVNGSDGSTTFSVNGSDVTLSESDLANTTWSNATEVTANVDALVKATNTQLSNDGAKFKAVNDSGKLKIQADDTSVTALKISGQGAVDLFGASSATTGVSGTQDTSVNLAKSVDDLVNEINNNSTLQSKVKASNDNGKLRIQNLSTQDLSIDGVNSSGTIDGSSANAATIDGNSVRSGFADQFNELRDQLDKLADDASFNGINLLRGDKLKITFNETGTSAIDIQADQGKSVDSANLGLQTTMEAKNFDSDTDIDSFLGDVSSALNKVRSQSSSFGSNLSVVQNRQEFTTSMINTLQTGAGNLTLADMNEQAANMVALQTRQSLATSSLSMANQADQGVLQLLR